VTAKLLVPILAVDESSGVAVMIPAGVTVDYECCSVVAGVADVQWNGENYFANVEDVVEATWFTDVSADSPFAWVN
jgi:hypothetical protein